MGEQLAAGLYVGLWESPRPASHSLSKAGIISGPAGHPLKDIPPGGGGGRAPPQRSCPLSPGPTAPWTGRIPERGGNPDAPLPAPSCPAARLRTACHMRWSFRGAPQPAPRGSPLELSRSLALQGLVSRRVCLGLCPPWADSGQAQGGGQGA